MNTQKSYTLNKFVAEYNIQRKYSEILFRLENSGYKCVVIIDNSSSMMEVIKNTNQNNKENPYPSSFSDGFGSLGYWGTTDY
jgi:hypothetical protein